LAALVPVLFASLNAGQLNALARHPAVVAIDDIPQDLIRHGDDAATSNHYPLVWSTATGAGTKIAVHEDTGVDNVNPFRNNATHNVLYWDPSRPNIDGHATNVAGVIASTHNWRRGRAFGINQILSANTQCLNDIGCVPYSEGAAARNIVKAAAWAIENGADSINMSWGHCTTAGGQDFYSRWVDYLVKTFGINIVVASGNNYCGIPDFVSAPSLVGTRSRSGHTSTTTPGCAATMSSPRSPRTRTRPTPPPGELTRSRTSQGWADNAYSAGIAETALGPRRPGWAGAWTPPAVGPVSPRPRSRP
jgi:hypothetical protein